jgi:hypothetical protein
MKIGTGGAGMGNFHRGLRCWLVLLGVAGATLTARAADQFTAPSKDELAMTSLPGDPGAAAVVLYREEITSDDDHATFFYDRIKILTDEGKKYANVEIKYDSYNGDWGWERSGRKVGDIVGRTIHPDGTILPFTGKPYLKTIEKVDDDYGTAKRQALVFTLPDVTAGSIIEYRYAAHINDDFHEIPDWIIQSDLYIKSAHYAWNSSYVRPIVWFPILPAGVQVQHHQAMINLSDHQMFELSVHDVPPQPEEEYMPPVANYGYRVLFYINSAPSASDFWEQVGGRWFHTANAFLNPNSELTGATQQIIAGAASDDEKLRRIYAAVEQIENTDYTRERERREDKANGLAKLNHVSDVLKNKRGNSTELTELFVGMARAAGMKAELMLVPDRSRGFFIPSWLTLEQFSNVIAVVNVAGKDQFFDPGIRFCAYGHLAWQHTVVEGLREKDNKVAFDKTPLDTITDNQIVRVANLTMEQDGHVSGKIDLAFIGSPALNWRTRALTGDDEDLRYRLRTTLEEMIPKSLEITGLTITGLEDYEKPLKVTYNVTGRLGTWTGKRLVLPADVFLAGAHASFPEEKRDLAVYFPYPKQVLDALRVNFPADITVEAAAAAAKFTMPGRGVYALSVASAQTSFTTRRTYAFNDVMVLPNDYPQLRGFYTQLEANDQQSVVLKAESGGTSLTTPSAN